jgi:hypothetical protein
LGTTGSSSRRTSTSSTSGFPSTSENGSGSTRIGLPSPKTWKDWTQDLLIHLRYLPATSKHRQAGKEDIVQTFDPHKHHGANQARFLNYINLCLGNKFRTIYSKRMKNPMCRPGNLSLTTHWLEADRDQVGDEFCHAHSAHLRKRCERQEKQREDGHLIGEFVDFVQREDSGVLPTMETMFATGTGNADFCGKRSRLRQLERCFLKSEPVPKQRRPYRRRVKRTAPSTPLGFRAS